MGGKGLGDRTAGPPGWRWLSRGLEEALLRFLAGAVDGGWAVRPRAPLGRGIPAILLVLVVSGVVDPPHCAPILSLGTAETIYPEVWYHPPSTFPRKPTQVLIKMPTVPLENGRFLATPPPTALALALPLPPPP